MTYITRICYNESNWQHPTGSATEVRTTYYSRHRYGHEEWLFRFEWQIGGWQYGFLQGVNKGRKTRLKSGERAGEVVLFTITPRGRRYVARIRHIEFLDEAQSNAALEIYKRNGWFKQMLKEIDKVEGVKESLGNTNWARYMLNVRFRPEDVEWFPEDTLATSSDPVMHWNRYQLIAPDQDYVVPETGVKRPVRIGVSVPPQQRNYFRNGSEGRECSPEHDMIRSALCQELEREYPDAKIVCEENYVDVTVVTASERILFEVKSDLSTRRVLRLAIGQLLEYAWYWEPHTDRNTRLVAVGRTSLDAADSSYLDFLSKTLGLPLSYRQVKLPSEA